MKTGGGVGRLRVRVSRLPLRKDGLIVQQEDAGVACRRSGCDSRWVHSNQSRGPKATTLGSHPGNDGSIPSGTTRRCPDTPIGRATRLKPECLQVRFLLFVLTAQRLGRQLADHLGLEPGMLWVRIPPELLKTTRPRGAAECSPPCHGGGHGFKSHRGC